MRPRARSIRSATGQSGRGSPGRRVTRIAAAGAVFALLGAGAAACSSSSSSSVDTSATSGSGKLTGNLTISAQSFGAPIIDPVIKAFQKANPNVHLTLSVASSSATTGYQTSLLTQKLAGNLPDIVNPQDVLSPTLSTDGITQSLSPYLAKGIPYKQDYWLPNILASYIPTVGPQKGQVFALPNEADAVVVYYNKDELKKAGVAVPSDN